MTTRDRIEVGVRTVLNQIATAADDNDLTELAQIELQRLWADISAALDGFNKPTGPDPFADGGPTQADVKGEVRHDIG